MTCTGACTFQLWKPQQSGCGGRMASITSAFQQRQQQRQEQRPKPVGLFSVAKWVLQQIRIEAET